jgi:FkbM family methyltransferase
LERAKPELFQWVDWHVGEGDVVWDIGANLGLFSFGSLVKSGTSGTVVAVEPDPWLVSLMEETLELWPERYSDAMSIITSVVTDRRGAVELNIAQRSRSSNYILDAEGFQSAGGVRHVIETSSVRLDDLQNESPPPDVVKIDVEGAEALVLQGGTDIAENARPIFIVEVAEQNRTDVKAFFEEASYRIYDAAKQIAIQDRVDSLPFNILAVPQEKIE